MREVAAAATLPRPHQPCGHVVGGKGARELWRTVGEGRVRFPPVPSPRRDRNGRRPATRCVCSASVCADSRLDPHFWALPDEESAGGRDEDLPEQPAIDLTESPSNPPTRFGGHRNICVQGAHDGEDDHATHQNSVARWSSSCAGRSPEEVAPPDVDSTACPHPASAGWHKCRRIFHCQSCSAIPEGASFQSGRDRHAR
jgi:hypothetical protein